MSSTEKPKLRVGIILTRYFTLSAYANFVDVLRLAADDGDRSRPIRCSWRIISSSMNSVRSSCGTSVAPDEKLADPSEFDYIVVIGGLIDEIEKLDPEYLTYLRRAKEKSIPLVGICTGAFVLYQAGLMEGYRCCVSWFHRTDFLQQFEGLNFVSTQIFVVDRDRLTCSGGVSSAHLAAFLVDRHIGASAARKSLNIMIIDEAMSEGKPQPNLSVEFTTKDQLVRDALMIMQHTIYTPMSVQSIASQLGTNRRKLERHFKDEIGVTPANANRSIRMKYACFLLNSTEKTITQIAHSTGFCDVSHFNKTFRSHMGTSPKVFRQSEELA